MVSEYDNPQGPDDSDVEFDPLYANQIEVLGGDVDAAVLLKADGTIEAKLRDPDTEWEDSEVETFSPLEFLGRLCADLELVGETEIAIIYSRNPKKVCKYKLKGGSMKCKCKKKKNKD